MQKKGLWIGAGLILGLMAVSGLLFFAGKPALHGVVIDPPARMPELQLTDQNGNPFRSTSLRGKIVLLYFGYTNCPDECPLTMAHLKQAVHLQGENSKDVAVIMVSTDPARDTRQALKEFLGKFNPDFIGLTGTVEDLEKTWKDFGVAVENGGETHSYFIYVLDRQGNLRETLDPDSLPADVAADIKLLLSEN